MLEPSPVDVELLKLVGTYLIHPTTQFMAFFSFATPPWKEVEWVLLVLTLSIVLLWGGPKLRRQSIGLLLKHLKLEQLLKVILFENNEKQKRITIIVNKAPFEELLQLIKEQFGYDFVCEEGILKHAKPVTISMPDATAEEILDRALCFQKSMGYSLIGKEIILKWVRKKEQKVRARQ
ncbi:MAG TPA: hypothetical protein VGZ71_06390 [Puia sp.]|jgi:hypothetical protein|nr:hypothetical protein [Puia sp.]